MKQQDFARLMVQKWKSVAAESTFLNHETIEKSLKLFRLHPFVVSPDCPGDCVLYDNDRPGQDDLDDDDDRDEGQRDEVEAQGGGGV